MPFKHIDGQRQLTQVGVLNVLAAGLVDDQPACRSTEKSPRLADTDQRIARAENPQEGVLGRVGGVLRAAQLAAQPTEQPAVVLAVQFMNRSLESRLDGGHEHTWDM
ncbi:hypothetical protein D3C72_1750940 [compost metagenome]